MKRPAHSVLMKLLATIVFVAHTAAPIFSQNVGIGTASPTEKLQVAGNVKADTIKPTAMKLTANAGDGKILTSDAAGNASWQSRTLTAGNIGYGVWGDCGTNGNISEYQPVGDTAGAVNDFFGCSVSVSGNFAIVGAHFSTIGGNAQQGSATIYQYNGNSWVFLQKITDPTGAAGDHFGISVSISGNYALVGAYLDDIGANVDRGSASIYQYNGSSWVFMQKLPDGGVANDNFGISVSIDGSNAIVGAFMDDVGANVDQGSASFYHYNGSSWVLTQKSSSGAAGDRFGISVSISGDNAIVGAMLDDVSGQMDQGSATFYRNNGVTGWDLIQAVTDANGQNLDNFGNAVAINGNYAIVGSFNSNVDTIADQGSVSIYQLNGFSWVFMQKIINVDGATNDRFGYCVAIDGNYAIIGSVTDDIGNNTDQGRAYIYQRVGTGWQKLQVLTDPGGTKNDLFGIAASLDGNTKQFIIGATGFNNATGKAIFGKIN